MKIKWYGHASFRITADNGTAIITDPYTPDLAGYSPVTEPPDIVIASSDNDPYHCRADLIPGDFVSINALKLALSGEAEQMVKGIPIRAIEAMEALDHPEHDPDQNGMYRFVVDGIQIGHIGDLGNPFNKKQIEFFQGVDVFLALAGGLPTIKLPDLKAAIDAIRPRLVVPMHFRTLSYKPRNTLWIESFLSLFDDHVVDFACHYEVTLTRENLPEPTRVLVLDYVKR
jgi:L-ascorbate metabolism protein UlaG (beta-lactamase superfamily)